MWSSSGGAPAPEITSRKREERREERRGEGGGQIGRKQRKEAAGKQDAPFIHQVSFSHWCEGDRRKPTSRGGEGDGFPLVSPSSVLPCVGLCCFPRCVRE